MTETKLEPVVSPGQDFTERLTVQELSMIGRQLKADPLACIADESHYLRWEAMALCAWALDKRRNPSSRRESFLELELPELLAVLRLDSDEEELARQIDAQAEEESPTGPTPGPA